jgi:hypothetical protein
LWSTSELTGFALYQKLKPKLNVSVHGVDTRKLVPINVFEPKRRCVKAVAWNIERGIQFEGI